MFPNRSHGRPIIRSLVVGLAVLLFGLPGLMDQRAAEAKAPAKASDKDELPKPEELQLTATDGMTIHATFYPGTSGKETVPLILLHGYKGKGTDFASLASHLQQRGHAVLVPDLRGHGQSTALPGSLEPLDPERMTAREFAGMIADVEACKKFLMEKHNAGELNIERLGVIGAEMGAALAVNWAQRDWSWPVLVTGKQGQDVKALVLISPQRTVKGPKGVSMLQALKDPWVVSLAMLIVVGKEDSREYREARSVFSLVKRPHAKTMVNLDPTLNKPDPNNTKDNLPKCTLFFLPLPTKLQGTKMLDFETLRLNQQIAGFIKLRLVDPKFPAWADRGRGK